VPHVYAQLIARVHSAGASSSSASPSKQYLIQYTLLDFRYYWRVRLNLTWQVTFSRSTSILGWASGTSMSGVCCEPGACAVTATALHKTTARILVKSFILREMFLKVRGWLANLIDLDPFQGPVRDHFSAESVEGVSSLNP